MEHNDPIPRGCVWFMKNPSLGGYNSASSFVAEKLRRFDSMEHDFASFFTLMFSEKENIIYERSEGYRIVRTSYGEAEQNALRRAGTLKSLMAGIPQEAVIGLYMENNLAWIECFWAILLAGFRPLLMNLRLDEQTLCSALGESGAAAVISDGKTFPVRTIPANDLLQDDIPADGPPASEFLVMSSGTSSRLKLCAYSGEELYHQIHDSYNIIRRCSAIKRFYHGQIKLLAFLPFYHVFGLIAVYIWFSFFSRTFVHLKDLEPQTILNTIRRHEVTHIFAVPLFWERVYQQAAHTIRSRGEKTWARFNRALSLSRRLARVPVLGTLFGRAVFREVRDNLFGDSIRFLITGGSSIRPEVIAFFNGIGYRLANGYGMSEIGISSVELSTNRRWLDRGFVGKPMSSLEYRVNREGELLVRGSSTARYILEDGVRHDRSGWFNTHDLAICERGHYRILGRRDDLVIGPNGENMNPDLIEDRIRCELLPELCLINSNGATILVSVPHGLTAEGLQRRESVLRERIAALGFAGQICHCAFIGEPLLRDGEFKLNRRKLREDYNAGRLVPVSPAAAPTDEDEFLSAVRDAIAAILEKSREDIAPGADFFLDLGGSSLDYLALIAALQERYGVDFPVENGCSVSTVDALADFIISAGSHVD